MPLISIVVPVYKVEKYLDRCVQSILNQTYTNYEIVLVDDGSPDKCGEICDDYAKRYEHIVVIHQENQGLSAARNVGIDWVMKNSDSEWITFIDSDDWIHPQYLEFLLKANIDFATDVSFGCYCETENYFISEDKISEKNLYSSNTEDVFVDKTIGSTPVWARLYKKKLFEEVRFPIGKLHEDRFTSYKIYFQVEKVSVVAFPIYYYFVNESGIVRSAWSERKMDDLEAAENQLKFFEENSYKKAFKHVLLEYIHLMVVDLRKIKNNKKFLVCEKNIRKKLRKVLKKYSKELNMSFVKDFNTYKYAYPIRAKIYRRLKSMLKSN